MSGYQSSPGSRAETLELEAIDRRSNSRKVIRVRARITVEAGDPLDVETIDLSHGGVGVTSKRPLNLEQKCGVELGAGALEMATSPVLHARVCYCARLGNGDYRLGLKFTFVSIEAAELIVAALS